MIDSINRDPFDGVFFFEEEFDRVNSLIGLSFSPRKSLIAGVLKYYYGSDIDLSEIQIRESVIWPSKFEEEKAVTLPFRKVYFISNFCPIEDLMKKNILMKAVIGFQSIDAELGSVIILEDFLKYFFRGRMYVYFDKDCKIAPLAQNEERLFDIQVGFISQFVRFFRKFYAKYCYTCSLSRPSLVIENTPADIGKYAGVLEFPELIVLSSLRRWILQSSNHLMGLSEFDEHFMIPFLASYLHTKSWNSYSGRGMIWTEPKVVKAFSLLVLEMMKVLESHRIRNLPLVHRYIEFHKALDNMDILDNKEELEEIVQNVRKENPPLPPGVDIWPAPSSVKRYPWK